MIRFAAIVLALLGAAISLPAQTVQSNPADTLYVIPAGPVAGTISNQARVTVVDTIAGWAKIQVEGWVPIRVALPYLQKGELEESSPECAAGTVKAKANDKPRQCEAITKKGKRCTRTAKPGSKYCWQHDK